MVPELAAFSLPSAAGLEGLSVPEFEGPFSLGVTPERLPCFVVLVDALDLGVSFRGMDSAGVCCWTVALVCLGRFVAVDAAAFRGTVLTRFATL